MSETSPQAGANDMQAARTKGEGKGRGLAACAFDIPHGGGRGRVFSDPSVISFPQDDTLGGSALEIRHLIRLAMLGTFRGPRESPAKQVSWGRTSKGANAVFAKGGSE